MYFVDCHGAMGTVQDSNTDVRVRLVVASQR